MENAIHEILDNNNISVSNPSVNSAYSRASRAGDGGGTDPYSNQIQSPTRNNEEEKTLNVNGFLSNRSCNNSRRKTLPNNSRRLQLGKEH